MMDNFKGPLVAVVGVHRGKRDCHHTCQVGLYRARTILIVFNCKCCVWRCYMASGFCQGSLTIC
ncbi:hypothetical protein DPMN_004759 [Dreissena polymorpha]|uniref:Uncharacterized protein n=1 Tax=Dreissena polymorpha TaxID=45954 RepID=A0A9D4MND8_DREPO|nr:hypothetical protein DPMN_004759 [Dreissena polymorpha]